MSTVHVPGKRNTKLPVLTKRFVVLAFALCIAVAIVPVSTLWLALLSVNAVLVMLATIDWFFTPSPSKMNVTREFPDVVTMGSTAALLWNVGNSSGRRVHIRLADEIPPSMRVADRKLAGRVPGNGRVTLATDIRPRRRGNFIYSTLAVRTYGPMGLIARQSRRTAPTSVRVYPPFGSRREAELRIERARVAEIGMRSVRSRGGGTEFEQLREYSVDDDSRRIDWFATARSVKPIVRTYRAEQNQNVMLLLDCGRVMAGKVANATRFEHVLDAALAVGTVATRLGDRVGLVAFDQVVRSEVALAQGNMHVARINDAIYSLQPRLVESDYRAAFVRMMARAQRRCMIIVLTEHATGATDETLLPALPLVSRKHLVVVAGVTDPDVSQWAHSSPTETSTAHRKAAAVASLRDRRMTLARLRAAGATTIDAEPGKLAPALADAYLEVKAAGKL